MIKVSGGPSGLAHFALNDPSLGGDTSNFTGSLGDYQMGENNSFVDVDQYIIGPQVNYFKRMEMQDMYAMVSQ